VKERPKDFERFGANWTPTQIILDETGKERYRIEGFSPKEDMLAHLELALARMAFEAQRFDEAARRYRSIVERFPKSVPAAEALYWAGVSDYKATHDASHLKRTAEALAQRYPGSEWQRKSTPWNG
jgi:TolA-binding protein